jgi:hypothetical protein
MATIVEFRKPPRREENPTARTDRSADIVFFPGVRYERQQDAEVPNRKKPKRRRDTLQLEN